MLTLAIDTTTRSGSVALLRDDALLRVLTENSAEEYSSRLFRQIEILFLETALGLPMVDLYAVAAGPGSFTGLRVGLTAVKGWAEAFGRPIAPVSALHAVASLARSECPLVAPLMDARRGQVFGGLYERNGARLARRGDEVVMSAAEFLLEISNRTDGRALCFVAPTPEVLSNLGPPGARIVEQIAGPLAPAIAALGRAAAAAGETVDALHLDANYVRRSDAELLWKDPL